MIYDLTSSLRVYANGFLLYDTLINNDTAWHVIELIYGPGKYVLTVDGKPATAPVVMGNRPTALWFGNTEKTGDDGTWPILEIDYVRIRTVN